MKHAFAFFLLSLSYCTFAQNVINAELPSILPPSPTASALMKYEEVPISYYTGLPSIEIPIFNGKLSNGNAMPVKLSYHPAGAKIKEIASDCGLGWSLIAGGSISRTVKGYPDEILERDGSNIGKVGIYQTSTAYHVNRFYEFNSQVESETVNTMSDVVNEYLWDVNVKGKYDTEHDMYQYNFMGYTGRFIIKKSNGILQVSKLDVNPLKIINHYDSGTFAPNSFTILDEDGNRYVFDVIEITESQQVTSSIPRSIYGNHGFSQNQYTFRSSFHLSKIYDNNGLLLAELSYSPNEFAEKTKSGTVTNYVDKYNVIPGYENLYSGLSTGFNPLPAQESSSAINLTRTRKLSGINIPGKEKISFSFAIGRQDSNLMEPSNSYKLSEIIIKSRHEGVEKKFTFQYTYSFDTETRMLLDKVKEYGNSTNYLERKLSYKMTIVSSPADRIDPPFGTVDFSSFGSPSANVLSQMTLPTGGYIDYNFGPSTYSYIGNSAIPDSEFINNIDNWNYQLTWSSFNTRNGPMQFFFSIAEAQDVKFHTSNNFSANISEFGYTVYKKVTTNGIVSYNTVANLFKMAEEGIPLPQASGTWPLTPGDYYVSFSSASRDVAGQPYHIYGTIGAYFKKWKRFNADGTRYYSSKQFEGNDVRINSINYFDGIKSKTEYFSYNFLNDPTRSSGSLVYPKPVFKSVKSKRECVAANGGDFQLQDFTIQYDAITTTDQQSVVKTKGYDVGYKNVTLSKLDDIDNFLGASNLPFAYKKMVFTSPIDYPEEIDPEMNTSYPFLPTLNIDYKRGLLINESLYNAYAMKVKETEYKYNFEDHVSNNGLRFFNSGNRAFLNYGNYTTYAAYKNFLNTCTVCFCYSGLPASFVLYRPIKEAYGWAKLYEVNSKEYYEYLGSVSETQTLFDYKPFNQKVGTEIQKLTDGNTKRTEYFYSGDANVWDEPNVATLNGRNAISALIKTESFKNNEKISTQKVLYRDWGNGMLKPEIIQQSKGEGDLENKIRFNAIDTSGNPREVQQELGSKICYIWGYNKTLPVAKIENCPDFNLIDSTKISAIEAASDNIANYSETGLINALKALRSETSLANAMITTYTYTRLSAISTITDAKGDMMKYSYDSFGNLESVRDKNGNILSESKYHYQNQF